jgi:hypothetical protein
MASPRGTTGAVSAGGLRYTLSAAVAAAEPGEPALVVDLELAGDASSGGVPPASWHAELPPGYVESIAARAGSPLPFAALVSALLAALAAGDGGAGVTPHGAASLSVLTTADLVSGRPRLHVAGALLLLHCGPAACRTNTVACPSSSPTRLQDALKAAQQRHQQHDGDAAPATPQPSPVAGTGASQPQLHRRYVVFTLAAAGSKCVRLQPVRGGGITGGRSCVEASDGTQSPCTLA